MEDQERNGTTEERGNGAEAPVADSTILPLTGSQIPDPRRFLTALKNMGIESYFFDRDGEIPMSTLRKTVRDCEKCALSRTRRQTVFGEGDERARLVFIGEAPGEEEDVQGRPFVGRAGKLLDRLIEKTGFRREEVYICNVLKCRPPGNRDPEQGEIAACGGYLLSQLQSIGPRVICTLGRHAYNTLMEVDERITHIRGKLTRFKGTTLLPTYHPSFLLRNEDRIKEVQEDMELLRRLMR